MIRNMLRSRKFALTVFGMLLASFMGLVSAQIPSIIGIYSTFIGGLIGVLGLYFGSNVGQKWVEKDKQLQLEETNGMDSD